MQYQKRGLGREQSKAQISVFFLIGFGLLAILLIALFIWTKVFKIDDNIVIPQEIQPAKNYVDFCLDESAHTAFFILGRQSGYINIMPDVIADPSRRISLANGAEIIPYWYYMNRNYVPTVDFVEQELSSYINTQFLRCINEYGLFQPGLIIKPLSNNATTSVQIGDKQVFVEIDFPMEISKRDRSMKTKLRAFRRTYDIRLRDMLEIGKYVLSYENTYYFLENATIGLMALNPAIPFTGLIPECEERTWNIKDIKRVLQYTLYASFPDIRVVGTDYIPFSASEQDYEDSVYYAEQLREEIEEVPLFTDFDEYDGYEQALNEKFEKYGKYFNKLPPDRYYYFNMRMPLKLDNSVKYENISVDFEYNPDYGMDIQAKPSSDGVLKSNNVKGPQRFLSALCINTYHFTYDVTYPVVVTIRDPDALNARGYLFRFAMPVIIRDNQGERTKQFMNIIPSYNVPSDYCMQNLGSKAVVKAYDRALNPLADVNISMLCVQKKCPLGVTKQRGFDAYLLVNLTTACGNPYILAEKEGYMPSYFLIEEPSDLIELDMVELKEFTVDLKKHNLYPLDNSIGPAQPVADGMVSLHLSGFVGDIPRDEYYVFFAGEDNVIQLPVDDSEYDVSITYLKNNEDFSGGYFGEWGPTKSQLSSGNTVELHLVEMISSTLDEDAARSVAELQNVTSELLKPSIR